jgi:hypothetical protein
MGDGWTSGRPGRHGAVVSDRAQPATASGPRYLGIHIQLLRHVDLVVTKEGSERSRRRHVTYTAAAMCSFLVDLRSQKLVSGKNKGTGGLRASGYLGIYGVVALWGTFSC